MIRTILTVLFVTIFLILSIPVWGVEWIVGKFNKKAMENSQFAIVQWAFKVVYFLAGARVTIVDEEKVPKDEAVLFVGNHASIFDIVIAYARVPLYTGFVAKNSIKKVPLLRTWMTKNHCVFIDRDDIRQSMQVILTSIEYVKEGYSIFIFPEGTRTKTGEMADFKDGSFKIATKSGCKVVPVAFIGTRDVFEKHSPRMKKTAVKMIYGDPIDLSTLEGEDKKHPGAYVQAQVAKLIEANK